MRCRIDSGAARSFNEPFVLAQEELHPDARRIFWDLRSRRLGGSFAPLDFTRKMNTHLDTDYLSEQLAGFPDQEMVYMIAPRAQQGEGAARLRAAPARARRGRLSILD